MAFLSTEDLDPSEFTEEELQQLMELGMIPGQEDMLAQQMEEANALRDAESPEGRYGGGVYTAAHPLEHAVHAIQGIKAKRDLENMRGESNDLLKKQMEGRMLFARGGVRHQLPKPQIEQADLEAAFANMQMPKARF